MKLMVIGGGGREHAIIKKLKENPAVEEIYCLPGNGGIAADAVCVPEIGAKDIPAQVEFAKAHRIDYAVVAPDDPLALGAVDALGGDPMADAFGLVAMVAMTPLLAIQALALVYAIRARKQVKPALARPAVEIIDFEW